jgi:hypothetical protein
LRHAELGSPQNVPLALKASRQALLLPVQWSAGSSSHAAPCEAPVHGVVLVLKTSTQALLFPVQWSAGSLSQEAHCEAPVQDVVAALNPLSVQPPLPLQ